MYAEDIRQLRLRHRHEMPSSAAEKHLLALDDLLRAAKEGRAPLLDAADHPLRLLDFEGKIVAHARPPFPRRACGNSR
jgi:hypothetical protein